MGGKFSLLNIPATHFEMNRPVENSLKKPHKFFAPHRIIYSNDLDYMVNLKLRFLMNSLKRNKLAFFENRFRLFFYICTIRCLLVFFSRK